MNLRGVAVGLALLLAACGQPNDTAPADTSIVLQCSGDSIDLTNKQRQRVSYLIKADPGNQFQSSLHYFVDAEKRYISPCIDKGLQCSVTAGPDIIKEVGIMKGSDGQVILEKMTEINRRTGAMHIQMVNALGEQPIFEGACTKGEAPAEQEQRF